MQRVLCAWAMGAVILLAGGCKEGEQMTPTEKVKGEALYVATNGNDAWSGKLAEPNAAKTDGPFATLGRARDEIRKMKGLTVEKKEAQQAIPLPAGGVTVWARGGVYALPETLKLGAEDGGTAEAPVVYRAYKGERPALMGCKAVTGFAPYKGKILKADVAAGAEGRLLPAALL